jgi:hypothetical protein
MIPFQPVKNDSAEAALKQIPLQPKKSTIMLYKRHRKTVTVQKKWVSGFKTSIKGIVS